MRQTLLFVMAFVLVAFNAGAAEYKSVASGVRYTHMGDYSVERLNTILSTEVAAFSSFKIQYPQAANGVSLYKVQYSTVIPEQGNKPTLVSGLVAVPLGMFSQVGIRPTRLTLGCSSAMVRKVPSTLAAPPMSYFISSMPAPGLSEMPPVSKVMPLPTSTSGACDAAAPW